MKSKNIALIIILNILGLMIIGGITSGILLSRKLKKVQRYSLVSEQNILDNGNSNITFVLFTNEKKAPHTQEEITQATLQGDNYFTQEITLKEIHKYYDETYNGQNFTAYTYRFGLPSDINEGLYTNLELILMLKNNKKFRYKVGQISLSRPLTIEYKKDDYLPSNYFNFKTLRSAALEVTPEGEVIKKDLPYRYNDVILEYDYIDNTPFEVLEVSYKVDSEGKIMKASIM